MNNTGTRRFKHFFPDSKQTLMQRMVFGLFAATIFSACLPGCFGSHWINVKNHPSCAIYDPDPVAGQTLFWHGVCEAELATGEGRLEVFEDGGLKYTLSGYVDQGYLSGVINFSVYENGVLESTYEQNWHKGRYIRRIRNITLDERLASAQTAREYLFFLARFVQNHPKAWIGSYYQDIHSRIIFINQDMALSGPESDRTGILKGEPLLQIYDYRHKKKYAFYSVFNTRPEALNDLLSGHFIPGGRQFTLDPVNADLKADMVPPSLPECSCEDGGFLEPVALP